MEHLSCFAGGMLAMGSRLLNRPQDLVRGTKLSQTCYFLGAAMKSGMQPERADFFLAEDTKRMEEVEDEDSGELFKVPKGTPAGVKAIHKHYLQRPESIE
jgi:mannosyl-oligosaccharide alpha-1,2-mannosidase